MSTRPRTPEHFPRMKVRGGTRRHGKRTPRDPLAAFNALASLDLRGIYAAVEAMAASIAAALPFALERMQEWEASLARVPRFGDGLELPPSVLGDAWAAGTILGEEHTWTGADIAALEQARKEGGR